jgi:hypothetical protein
MRGIPAKFRAVMELKVRMRNLHRVKIRGRVSKDNEKGAGPRADPFHSAICRCA